MTRHYYSGAARDFLVAFNAAQDEPVFRGVGFRFDERQAGTVEVRNFGVEGPRGEGRGTAALRRVCEIADEAGVALYVQAHSADPATAARLSAWYRREGFTDEVDAGRLVRPASPRPGAAP